MKKAAIFGSLLVLFSQNIHAFELLESRFVRDNAPYTSLATGATFAGFGFSVASGVGSPTATGIALIVMGAVIIYIPFDSVSVGSSNANKINLLIQAQELAPAFIGSEGQLTSVILQSAFETIRKELKNSGQFTELQMASISDLALAYSLIEMAPVSRREK